MKLFRNLIFFCAIIFGVTCTTYDNAIIYHRNFVPGTNPLLKFDGYYSDSIPLIANDINRGMNVKADVQVKPVFFYSNGSCFSTNNYTLDSPLSNLVKTNRLFGSWGNYLISGDTIQLEKFQLLENNYELIILKGVISKDKIHWSSRKEHKEDFKPVDYSIYFHRFSSKPDSTLNFTRTKKKYNKIPLQ